tara:strand:+ start:465 stop:593 length:129 start_codon:yes stop_codon:yes gene_type:complete
MRKSTKVRLGAFTVAADLMVRARAKFVIEHGRNGWVTLRRRE